MADDWVHAGAEQDVPRSAPWPEVAIGEHAVVLVRDGDGQIRAARSRCPHLAAPLTRADVVERGIECNRHFYTYDLLTGRNTVPGEDADLALPIHDVEVRDGQVWVHATALSPATSE